MARPNPKPAAKVKPSERAATSATAGSDAAESAAERNITRLNEEAFEGAMELQMSFLEAASRFAREFSDFAARRTEANIADFSKLAGARTPPELLQVQLQHMRAMFEDYSTEASRMLAISEDVMKETGEAVRSSYLNERA